MPLILNLNDPAIQLLQPGVFAIPNLEWENELPAVIGDTKSIKAAATNMRNHGYENFINSIIEQIGNELNTENLSLLISSKINQYHLHNNHQLLNELFHLIQLWGGNESRRFYFNNINIDIELYENYIHLILNSNDVQNIVNETINIVEGTMFFNISFVTKHVSLWQRFSINSQIQLPIYDKIIANNIMGRNVVANDYTHLLIYWNEMLEVSELLGLPMNNIERQIFNFFRNGTPETWPRPF